MEPRVTLVTLGVADLGRAERFYTALGFPAQPRPDSDDVVFLQAGGLIIGLWDRARLAEDSGVTHDAGGWGGITLAHNVRSPAEVDVVLRQARAAGGEIRREAAETFWGGYSGLFADPDGHPWEVAHNPFWALGADGTVRLDADQPDT